MYTSSLRTGMSRPTILAGSEFGFRAVVHLPNKNYQLSGVGVGRWFIFRIGGYRLAGSELRVAGYEFRVPGVERRPGSLSSFRPARASEGSCRRACAPALTLRPLSGILISDNGSRRPVERPTVHDNHLMGRPRGGVLWAMIQEAWRCAFSRFYSRWFQQWWLPNQWFGPSRRTAGFSHSIPLNLRRQ